MRVSNPLAAMSNCLVVLPSLRWATELKENGPRHPGLIDDAEHVRHDDITARVTVVRMAAQKRSNMELNS